MQDGRHPPTLHLNLKLLPSYDRLLLPSLTRPPPAMPCPALPPVRPQVGYALLTLTTSNLLPWEAVTPDLLAAVARTNPATAGAWA